MSGHNFASGALESFGPCRWIFFDDGWAHLLLRNRNGESIKAIFVYGEIQPFYTAGELAE